MATHASLAAENEGPLAVRPGRRKPPPLPPGPAKRGGFFFELSDDGESLCPLPPPPPPDVPSWIPSNVEPSADRSRWVGRRLRTSEAVLGSLVLHIGALIALAALAIAVETRQQDPLLLAATTVERFENPLLEELVYELEPLEDQHFNPEQLEQPSVEASPVEFDAVDVRAGGGGHIGFEGDLPVPRGQAFRRGAGGTGGGDGFGDGEGSGGRDIDTFGGIIDYVQTHGLDVVLTFDSTGSMGGEILVVKHRILQIGGALIQKVPKTRIGICTYRDTTDRFLVVGLPLSNQLPAVYQYLIRINAAGGGDTPEAVHSGLQWSMSNNLFRPKARKVILLFGDAAPHPEHLATCIRLAQQFYANGGIVNTITCRQCAPLPEFVAIARAGGGEAFVIRDHRRIMEELLVLVFGGRHRDEVMKFFDLEDAPFARQRPGGPE